MSTKFQDKYRISSTRLQNWDYSWDAIYFVTINTHGQEDFFGEIRKDKMILSNLGVIANVFGYEIKNHFPVVDLDAFVVMPNHVHGILAINNSENLHGNQETRHALSRSKSPGEKRFQNQGKNALSSIIGSYKSAVSKHAHRLGFRFDWQSRFHDRIIRDQEAMLKARKYIENNVANWNDDPFNSKLS